jgi:hypothetical protein
MKRPLIGGKDFNTSIEQGEQAQGGVKDDAFLSSLLDPLEGPSVLKCETSWNLGPPPTSSIKGGERGVLEVSGLD